MMLKPREWFTIARGLEDHTDTNTYYVRAVIKNSRTNEIIETINLDDSGDGHLFLKPWQVVADSSGQGFYIVIITSVYTDAGYTVKGIYGDKYDTYLVDERVNANLGFGGGGGPDIDYKRIRKIVEEVCEKPEKTDLKPVLEAIRAIKMPDIKFPEQIIPERIDLTGITTKLQEIEKIKDLVKSINIPEVNLIPLFDKIEEHKVKMESLQDLYGNADKKVEQILTKITDFFRQDMEDIKLSIENVNKRLDKLNEKPKIRRPL